VTAVRTSVRDFTMLLPPGWARIPLDDRAPVRVRSLVARRLGAAPAEQREALRASLTKELTATLATAARNGGLDVFLSLDPVAGMPVPASALVTHLAVGEGGDDPLGPLMARFAAGGAGLVVEEIGVVAVADAPAVRRLSSRREAVPPAGDQPGGVFRVTQLEYLVPVPDVGGVLVIAFSTPVEWLGPSLVGLFDVMATSLRWVGR
jgi:hypothetical protein